MNLKSSLSSTSTIYLFLALFSMTSCTTLKDHLWGLNSKEQRCTTVGKKYPQIHKDIEFSTLECNAEEFELESSPEQLTETFSIPKGDLGRRVRFWKRVFSEWSKFEYIVHSKNYPEVVLESGKLKGLPREASNQEHRMLRSQMAKRVRHYKRVLARMQRKLPKDFDEQEKRIAQMMSHISDQNKYITASRTLGLQRGQKEFIEKGYITSGKYLAHIKSNFLSEGVPPELAYIAFIESSFNLKALSKVGASGVYQIMPATGREFIRVTNTIDERKDPIKSSKAAAKVFKRALKITGSWPLAITSYNHGPYGILKAVKKAGTRDLETLIKTYKSRTFGVASKNFYVEYLAILSIMKKKDIYFDNMISHEPLKYHDVKISKRQRLSSVIKTYNTNAITLMSLNPDISKSHFRYNGYLPKGYVLKIPQNSSSYFPRKISER